MFLGRYRNILKTKSKKIDIEPESVEHDFASFWREIEARRDLKSSINEWNIKYNTTKYKDSPKKAPIVATTLEKTIKKIDKSG
jgi:hypothetical protein